MAQQKSKVAIFVLADLETNEGKGRVVNALHAVREFKAAGDHVDLVFDGAGTRAAVMIAQPDHQMNALFKEVEDTMTGICRFCANMYGATADAEALGLPFVGSDHQHASFRNFISNGYQVINF